MEFWHEAVHPKYPLPHAYLHVAKNQPELCGLSLKELSSLNCTLDPSECCGNLLQNLGMMLMNIL